MSSTLLRMLRAPLLLAVAAACGTPPGAQAQTLTVSAVILSASNCKFRSAATAINFGAVDPSSTASIVQTTTVTIRCGGSANPATFLVAAGTGLYPSAGINQMRHATTLTEFMAYSLAVSPSSGTVAKNVDTSITITGTLAPAAFANAVAGNYSDTVQLTLTP